MATIEFEALPGENNAYAADMSDSLPDDVTLSASGGTAEVYDSYDIDVTDLILASASVTTSASTNLATITLKTGAKPWDIYRVRLNLVQSNGKVLQEDATLVIREQAL
jgi:hypothetical protein